MKASYIADRIMAMHEGGFTAEQIAEVMMPHERSGQATGVVCSLIVALNWIEKRMKPAANAAHEEDDCA